MKLVVITLGIWDKGMQNLWRFNLSVKHKMVQLLELLTDVTPKNMPAMCARTIHNISFFLLNKINIK